MKTKEMSPALKQKLELQKLREELIEEFERKVRRLVIDSSVDNEWLVDSLERISDGFREELN